MSNTRPRPPVTDSGPGQGLGAVTPFKRQVSPEGRQRLSELATQRHRQGGFQKSSDGKPRRPSNSKKKAKRRVSARVAEAAREKKTAQNIIDVFRDGIHPNQPMSVRLKAAEAWIKVEQEDAKLRLKEEAEEGVRHDRAELLEVLSNKLTSGHSAMLLKKQLDERAGIDSDVIEGSIVEDPP
jgi:hypothetical protein